MFRYWCIGKYARQDSERKEKRIVRERASRKLSLDRVEIQS